MSSAPTCGHLVVSRTDVSLQPILPQGKGYFQSASQEALAELHHPAAYLIGTPLGCKCPLTSPQLPTAVRQTSRVARRCHGIIKLPGIQALKVRPRTRFKVATMAKRVYFLAHGGIVQGERILHVLLQSHRPLMWYER
ncbi:hypothetical protein VTI74DRAFT_447 [Chaetomium olivicolor]